MYNMSHTQMAFMHMAGVFFVCLLVHTLMVAIAHETSEW